MKKFIGLVKSTHFQIQKQDQRGKWLVETQLVRNDLGTMDQVSSFLALKYLFYYRLNHKLLDPCICESHILPDYFPFIHKLYQVSKKMS